ncbi:hypothetical protein JCM21900_005539 [Sporobolomyces salmonicolor]
MSSPQDHPGAPASLSEAQISRILKSPIHIHIKRLVYSILALGVIGTLSAFVVIALSCIWGKAILREERWLIFHYVVAGIFSALWLVYSYVYLRDVKFLAWPGQLQIDSGWIMVRVVLPSVAFFFYIYGKMRTYGTADLFDASCSTSCTSKRSFVKLSPLIVAVINLVYGLIQLVLMIVLYRNPIISLPLDQHGMPKPVDPFTGKLLPFGADGRPIYLKGHSKTKANTDKDMDNHKEKGKAATAAYSPSETDLSTSENERLLPMSDSETEGKRPLAQAHSAGPTHVEDSKLGRSGGKRGSGREHDLATESGRRGSSGYDAV